LCFAQGGFFADWFSIAAEGVPLTPTCAKFFGRSGHTSSQEGKTPPDVPAL
jgi:hypothetical protein